MQQHNLNMQQKTLNMKLAIYMQLSHVKLATTKEKHATDEVKNEIHANLQHLMKNI